jgi:hypothetical protein
MKLLRTIFYLPVAGLVLFLGLTVVAQTPVNGNAQATPVFAGKYQGVAKDTAGDLQITLQLNDGAGKFSGQLATPQEQFEIVKGQLVDGLLSLELNAKGSPAKLSLRRKDGNLVGELSRGAMTKSIELKRIDELSGDWEAVANVDGQNYPFALTLKIDGDKITGSSVSELGNSTISKGTVKDGKLAFQLDGGAGTIIMTASLQDGNLVGDFDFNGQLQGRWVAVKRK